MHPLISRICAFFGLLFLLPILGLISVFVYIFIGAPILFRQERPGLNDKPFLLFKFRTMRNDVDDAGNTLPDDKRMTKFGGFLRSTSLDELPTLYNVLMGDMVLVGPRPLLMEYLPLYNARQSKRSLVRPGITGWAQINGRNALSWEQKFEYDVWYVENRSFLFDCKILIKTFKKVIFRDGISADNHVTIERFTGTSD